MHDKITGLYDRQHFLDILCREVTRCSETGVKLCLLVVEIQQFRKINAIYGYSVGDQVLKSFGDVIREVIRVGDSAARIGNDTFALLITRVMNVGHAELAAFKLQKMLEIPFEAGGKSIRCEAVAGLALCPLHSSRSDELLRFSEDALEYAKRHELPLGVTKIAQEKALSETWDLEYELGGAIDRSELRVYFQPKVTFQGDTLVPVGAEALVKWESDARGLLSPAEFLPIAEKTGFIKTLTVWMLNSALRLSGEWPKRWSRLTVSVNIPPVFLAQPDFVDQVLSTERLWHEESVGLCLEIVEQSIVDDTTSAFTKLKELREHGIKTSIDDFGTGYSSLSYFRDLPADELKIDKSFIQDLVTNEASLHITTLIIELAHRFGLSVVAEGVEDAETLALLRKLGCDQIQGFLIAKPMPAEEFKNWMKRL